MKSDAETLAAALQHHQAGNLQQAEQLYQQILLGDPDNADALQLLGVLAHQAGRNDLAMPYLRQALAINPRHVAGHFNLGVVYQAVGRVPDAEACYRQALQLNPSYPEAHNNLGQVLRAQGQLPEAEAAYRKAVRLRHDYVDARYNLGLVLQAQGRFAEAEAAYRKALDLNPDYVLARYDLGGVLQAQGRYSEAEACFRDVVRLRPAWAEAHSNLGAALQGQGRLPEAEAAYRQALQIRPGFAEVLNNLGNALQEQGRIAEAETCLREALRLQPEFGAAYTSFLLCLSYDPASSPAQLLAEHRAWAARCARAPVVPPRHGNDRSPDRRLRVGYVSPDLRRHPIAAFLEPVLAHHDPQQVEVFCYADVPAPDATTARLRALSHGWRSACGLSHEQLAALIRTDGIDLLVDLAGHTSGNRLPVFARRPAPVQLTYLGYPTTTGLSTIDYRLTDAVADPPGEPCCHTEELVRLPGCFCCYAPPEDAPAITPAPALRIGQITFGSLHHLARLNARVLDLWSRLLHAVPSARLLLFRHTLAGEVQQSLRRAFAQRGIGEERLSLSHELPPGPGRHLRAYADVDVALDTFPWSGHTTACEALWMGVPVLTLRGDRHAGRMVSSVLTCVGLTDWIAATPEQWLERAVTAAASPERLAALRSTLRETVRTSPLCDGAGFTRSLEQAYRRMWQRWCEQRPEATTAGR